MGKQLPLKEAIILAILAYLFRRGAGEARREESDARKEAREAKAREASLDQEIRRLKNLMALEARLGVVVGTVYSSEHLQAFGLVQNVDILRDAVTNRLLPSVSIRQDLSSDPASG